MSTFEDRNKGLGGHDESEIEVERDVVIVDSENTVSRSQRNPFAVLPILLGVLFLLANLLIFARVPTVFTGKSAIGTISLLMILVSVFISLSLIIYGLAARRSEEAGEGRGRHLRTIGVPLLLVLLAPMFTLWALQVNRLADERYVGKYGKPCIEIYEKAAAIAKDNPRFRMPATDNDEVRCQVNAALGG
jgi:hypothetical protein